MKDIIRNVVLAVLVLVVIIAAAAFVLKGDEPDTTTTTAVPGTSAFADGTTAPQGNQVVQPDVNVPQNTTGSQGGDNSQQLQPNQPQQTTTTSVSPAQPTQAPAQQDNTQPQAPQSSQPNQPSQPQSNYVPTTSAIIVNPQQPNQPQQVNKIDAYQAMFRSGKFYMKIKDPELGDATMAMSGNKMFVETTIEGISLKMLYDGDKPDEDNPQNGSWYMIVDKIKKYSPLPSEMVGDMNVEELTKNFAGDDSGNSSIVYTKSTETIDGVTYDCESCVDSSGNTTKYYFIGDQLVRSDSISPSGAVSTTEFKEITGDFDDSVFAIPAGYAKWDISWLMKMMG